MECPHVEKQRSAIRQVYGSGRREFGSERTAPCRDALCGGLADAGAAQVDRTDGRAFGNRRAESAAVGKQQSVE